MAIAPLSPSTTKMAVVHNREGNYASACSLSHENQETDQGLTLSPKIPSSDFWQDDQLAAFGAFTEADLNAFLGPVQVELLGESFQRDDEWFPDQSLHESCQSTQTLSRGQELANGFKDMSSPIKEQLFMPSEVSQRICDVALNQKSDEINASGHGPEVQETPEHGSMMATAGCSSSACLHYYGSNTTQKTCLDDDCRSLFTDGGSLDYYSQTEEPAGKQQELNPKEVVDRGANLPGGGHGGPRASEIFEEVVPPSTVNGVGLPNQKPSHIRSTPARYNDSSFKPSQTSEKTHPHPHPLLINRQPEKPQAHQLPIDRQTENPQTHLLDIDRQPEKPQAHLLDINRHNNKSDPHPHTRHLPIDRQTENPQAQQLPIDCQTEKPEAHLLDIDRQNNKSDPHPHTQHLPIDRQTAKPQTSTSSTLPNRTCLSTLIALDAPGRSPVLPLLKLGESLTSSKSIPADSKSHIPPEVDHSLFVGFEKLLDTFTTNALFRSSALAWLALTMDSGSNNNFRNGSGLPYSNAATSSQGSVSMETHKQVCAENELLSYHNRGLRGYVKKLRTGVEELYDSNTELKHQAQELEHQNQELKYQKEKAIDRAGYFANQLGGEGVHDNEDQAVKISRADAIAALTSQNGTNRLYMCNHAFSDKSSFRKTNSYCGAINDRSRATCHQCHNRFDSTSQREIIFVDGQRFDRQEPQSGQKRHHGGESSKGPSKRPRPDEPDDDMSGLGGSHSRRQTRQSGAPTA